MMTNWTPGIRNQILPIDRQTRPWNARTLQSDKGAAQGTV